MEITVKNYDIRKGFSIIKVPNFKIMQNNDLNNKRGTKDYIFVQSLVVRRAVKLANLSQDTIKYIYKWIQQDRDNDLHPIPGSGKLQERRLISNYVNIP